MTFHAVPSRSLVKEHSKDDLELLQAQTTKQKSSFVYKFNNASAPAKQPVASTSASVFPTTIVQSPSKPAVLPLPSLTTKDKGKGKAPTHDQHFLDRLYGQSANKAGVPQEDKARFQHIIAEASKGSSFSANEQKKSDQTEQRVRKLSERIQHCKAERKGDLRNEEREAESVRKELEMNGYTNYDQTVAVADADAFYASVEELDNPDLVGKPFGVGSGVLTTASYAARKFGCRSGMPGYIAKKLCPDLIFVKPDFSKYSAASKLIMDVLRRFDENMAPASLDEAYLNITKYLARTGKTGAEAAEEMRHQVKEETGLTISVGVGPIKMVAKIAADINKPNGQCVIDSTPEAVNAFLHPLSVRKIPGIGRVAERILESLEIKTVADIWTNRGVLMLIKDQVGATGLFRAFLGIGSSNVEAGRREDRKSVGTETTFRTIWKEEDLFEKLREVADSLGEDLERTNFSGRTITLKIKMDTYEVFTRAHTSGHNIYISSADDLYKLGKQLLEKELYNRHKAFDTGQKVVGAKGGRDLRLRLMGLKASNLRDESEVAQQKRATQPKGLEQWTRVAQNDQADEDGFRDEEDADDQIVELDIDGHPLEKASKRQRDDLKPVPCPPPRPLKRPKTVGLPPNPHTSINTLLDVSCPACAECYGRISFEDFNSHLDGCLDGSSKPEKAQKKTVSHKKKESKGKEKDAFKLIMKKAKKR